mmetsp:Transcript_16757/g.18754  ORF Transcript_16757/g.18754 Transcript_16757/m.18754 type:complete len:108 (-) Transcript_16757:130-453(-)
MIAISDYYCTILFHRERERERECIPCMITAIYWMQKCLECTTKSQWSPFGFILNTTTTIHTLGSFTLAAVFCVAVSVSNIQYREQREEGKKRSHIAMPCHAMPCENE